MIRASRRVHWHVAAAFALPAYGSGKRSQCVEGDSTKKFFITAGAATASAFGIFWLLKSKQLASNADPSTIGTIAELESYLGGCFDAWDTDKNGFLEREELLALGLRTLPTLEALEDLDGKHKFLNLVEKQMGRPFTEDEHALASILFSRECVIRVFDLDKDRKVSREEFIAVTTRQLFKSTDADVVLGKLKNMSAQEKKELSEVFGAKPELVKACKAAAEDLWTELPEHLKPGWNGTARDLVRD